MRDGDTFHPAVQRVEFRLTYGRTENPRRFLRDELDGPLIPDARQDDAWQAGSWLRDPSFEQDGFSVADVTQRDWLEHFLTMAINEGVHEVLEHFHVDGRPYLDPHGEHEEEICNLVDALASKLAAIAEGGRGRE
ncbi:hypothetical protein [Streptomyces sp. NRRL F-5053]|uniref:hypothetical protein n=1 Tax=Streptomyces sp. NRRL F-5053 TaxID=1463854 RepID=UPI001331C1B5|nr:hypothetical protein [Streptomyces sp. NRRL F-5053]